MLDYNKIYEATSYFLSYRKGFAGYKDFDQFVEELTGIICAVARECDCDSNSVIKFLALTFKHELKKIPRDGRLRPFDDIVDDQILRHVLHKPFSERVMRWIPGSVQAGKGEALFCIYDKFSTLGTDPNVPFDIIVQGTDQLKSVPNNFCKPSTFDNYTSDNITIVKDMTFASTKKEDWKQMVKFTQTERQIKKNEFSMKLVAP